MITRMMLCALMLLVNESLAADQDPKPTVERKADQKIAPAPQPQPSPLKAGEKKTDDVKLIAIEANLISYTNQERARYGLPALEVDKELMATAREHAAWMTRCRVLAHTGRPVAENIAMGQSNSGEAVGAWMHSPGHRANILNVGHRRIGVAAFRTESGTIYWCQQFRG